MSVKYITSPYSRVDELTTENSDEDWSEGEKDDGGLPQKSPEQV